MDTGSTEKNLQRIFQSETSFREVAALKSQIIKRREIHNCKIISNWLKGHHKAWKLLARALIATKKTHRFLLHFTWNFRVLDGVFSSINGDLKMVKNLQHITFQFFHSFEITEVQVRKACQGIKKLSSVKKINLNFFSRCTIADVGIEIIAKTIKKFKFLQDLSLQIPDWRSLTDQGVNTLSKSLKRLVYLQKIDLSFVS